VDLLGKHSPARHRDGGAASEPGAVATGPKVQLESTKGCKRHEE